MPMPTQTCRGGLLAALQETRFEELAGGRLGLSVVEVRHLLARGLSPYVELARDFPDRVVPSPAVGTLLDLAREYGGPAAQSLLAAVPDPLDLDPAEHLRRYAETRRLVSESAGGLDVGVWPAAEAFEVRAFGYKNCSPPPPPPPPPTW
jgi:hypothetical protein